MNFRKYMVYLDGGDVAFKCAIPAINEESAREYANGNGEVIAVKDVTDSYIISRTKLLQALKDSNFDYYEANFIIRTLEQVNFFGDTK